jgi:hypothetical protein
MRLGLLVVLFGCGVIGATLLRCTKAPEGQASTGEASKLVEAPAKTIDPTTTGTVSGTISFLGKLPESTMIRASSDAACAKAHPGEFDAGDVLVHDGKVENAFVWVKSGLDGYRFAAPADPVKVNQLGCMYHPRVLGARANQDIVFTNSDPTLHNIASKPTKSTAWNFVTPQGASGSRSIKKPEVMVKVGCDVHPWMRAYIGVLDHPFFAVTGADGRFKLAGLPPGTYTLGVWHERLGSSEQPVTLPPKSQLVADFALPGTP